MQLLTFAEVKMLVEAKHHHVLFGSGDVCLNKIKSGSLLHHKGVLLSWHIICYIVCLLTAGEGISNQRMMLMTTISDVHPKHI